MQQNGQIDGQFEERIIASLADSINPDNTRRQNAEATLKEAQHISGYATALLKISGDISLKNRQFAVQIDINHAASI